MSWNTPAGASVFRNILRQDTSCHPTTYRQQLSQSSKDSLDFVQRLGLLFELPVHMGCVNTIHWNQTGEYIVSGSDDQRIVITNPHSQKVLFKCKTAHCANIFSARFMPHSNDESIVSCSGDGIVLHMELRAPYIKRCQQSIHACDTPSYECDIDKNVNYFSCHKMGTTYEVMTLPMEPKSFISCGEDGTVRLFDLRHMSNCREVHCKDNILIFSPSSINSMDMSPISGHYLAIGGSDSIVRIYDRRYLSLIDFGDSSISSSEKFTQPVKAYAIPLTTKRQYRITCVRYSPEETELLASFSSEYLYLFDLKQGGVSLAALTKMRKSDINAGLSAAITSEFVTRRLRLRGDWSDTGPDARPEDGGNRSIESGQFRPQLQTQILNRLTEVVSRMLSDPRTRSFVTSHLRQNFHSPNRPSTNENQSPNAESQDSRPSTSRAAWRMAASRSFNLSHRSDAQQVEALDYRNNTNEFNSSQPSPSSDIDIAEDSSNDRQQQQHQKQQQPQKINDMQHCDEDTSNINEELADLEMDVKEIVYDYMKMKYVGHRNARTMIKEAAFWGSNYVMSGSDCGHIFIWNRHTGKLVMLMQADQHVVNCLQPHPELPYLATSGIDYDVKVWAPVLPERGFCECEAEALMKRNAIMLEQTKDTITVPAAFLIRMLAFVHSMRNQENRHSAHYTAPTAANTQDYNDTNEHSSILNLVTDTEHQSDSEEDTDI